MHRGVRVEMTFFRPSGDISDKDLLSLTEKEMNESFIALDLRHYTIQIVDIDKVRPEVRS